MKKYEMTAGIKVVCGVTLHRIKALISFDGVEKGELGGWIEKEENLSQEGNAWVCDNAYVTGDAQVYGNAWVLGNVWVRDNAQIYGNALIRDNAQVYDNAQVCGDAQVCDNVRVSGNAGYRDWETDRKSTRLNSSHSAKSRMPSSA